MRPSIAIALILMPVLLLAQGPDRESVEALIKKLGSTNFQDRQAATKAMKERPEAVPALRDALRSADPELRKRAAEILEHFEPRPFREIDAAVKEGRVDRFIELLAAWPAGKHEEGAWTAFCDLA